MPDTGAGGVQGADTLAPGPVRILVFGYFRPDPDVVERRLRATGWNCELLRVADLEAYRTAIRAGRVDAVLCDEEIDGLSCEDALAEFRSVSRSAPFLIVTNTADEEEIASLMRSGATDVILRSGLVRLGPSLERAIREARTLDDLNETVRGLHRARELQRAVFESVDQGIAVVKTFDERIRIANPALASMFETTIDQLLNRHVSTLFVTEDAYHAARSAVMHAVKRARPYQGEHELVRPSSGTFAAEISVTRLSHLHGWSSALAIVIKDVTDRRYAREQIITRQREFETIINNAPDIILRTDLDDRVLLSNSRVAELFGAAADAQPGMTLVEWARKMNVDVGTFDRWTRVVRSVIETASARNAEFISTIDGRHFHLQARMVPERDDSGKVVSVLSFIRDITGQRLAESTLQVTERNLQRAQRLESVGQLAGGIAHDFNNILTAVHGYIHLALIAAEPGHPVREYLENLKASTDRASRLTHQLLLFSRKTPSELKVVDLNLTIESMLKMLGRLIGENISLTADLQDNIWLVCADAGKIEQVVMNLVINSRDAMPDGGRILIRTRNLAPDAGVAGSLPQRFFGRRVVCISVHDNGFGMDRDTAARVFEPFFTTKGRERGTGLGLAVAHGIVQEHEGWIEVESAPGKGTTFYVYIPAQERESTEAARESDERRSSERPGSGERILVVEDESDILKILDGGLTSAGYDVTTASTISDALRCWSRKEGGFDLTIVDMVLPDGSGLSLLEQVQPSPDRRFIFVSGYLDDTRNLELLKQKHYRFLNKPYTIAGLLSVVREELGGHIE